MGIELKAITQKYGDLIVLEDLNLMIDSGEMMVLLGPSGCGKTTLIKTIAGLLPLYQGQIWLNGADISHLPPQARNAAMVFQNYALFPHMTVEENIAYGLKIRGADRAQQKARVEEILLKIELTGLNKRKISELSGGQQQRVALARALVVEPAILLFDEPLSNLDQRLRIAMRQKIRQIQQEYGITSIYITHDQEEAFSIADRIVVLKDGHIEQIGTPSEVYLKPKNRFVADFMAAANILDLHVHAELQSRLPGKASEDCPQNHYLMFRPEDIEIVPNGEWEGLVVWHEIVGSVNKLTIDYHGSLLLAEIKNYYKNNLKINNGDRLKFSVDLRNAQLLPN